MNKRGNPDSPTTSDKSPKKSKTSSTPTPRTTRSRSSGSRRDASLETTPKLPRQCHSGRADSVPSSRREFSNPISAPNSTSADSGSDHPSTDAGNDDGSDYEPGSTASRSNSDGGDPQGPDAPDKMQTTLDSHFPVGKLNLGSEGRQQLPLPKKVPLTSPHSTDLNKSTSQTASTTNGLQGFSNDPALVTSQEPPAFSQHNQLSLEFDQEEPILRHELKGTAGESSSTPRVDCARVMQGLERLTKQCQPKGKASSSIYEKNSNKTNGMILKKYFALEFCLRAMDVLSDVGKEFIAFYIVKKDSMDGGFAGTGRDEKESVEEDLIDIEECRRFVTRIGHLLKSCVRERFTTGCRYSALKKLKLYYKCSCFLTGEVDVVAQSVFMPEAVKNTSTSSFDKRVDEPAFSMFRLSPLLMKEPACDDFWLFASQITGVTGLKERAAILIPAKTPEEFLLLEKAIAKQLNKFAMTIVVEGGIKAVTKASDQRLYEVLYDPDFITDETSLEHLRELGVRRSGSQPPSLALLDLHHRLYRLLHETKVGRAWMKESDWDEIDHTIPPPEKIIYREYSPVSELDDEESEGEEDPALQPADEYLGRDQSTALAPFDIDDIFTPEEQQVLSDEIDKEKLDAEYTLTKAFESRR